MKFQNNPVLLIPGFYSDIATFNKLFHYLTNSGKSVYIPNLTPNTGELGLDDLAWQLNTFIFKTFPPKQKLDIVGFSMGGIISRYYIQRLGGINRVEKFVTVSSPHYGTWTSCLCFRPACQQLHPESQFLRKLNKDIYRLNQLNITSIWTPFDLIIVPSQSAILPIGKKIAVHLFSHSSIVDDDKICQILENTLKEPIISKLPCLS